MGRTLAQLLEEPSVRALGRGRGQGTVCPVPALSRFPASTCSTTCSARDRLPWTSGGCHPTPGRLLREPGAPGCDISSMQGAGQLGAVRAPSGRGWGPAPTWTPALGTGRLCKGGRSVVLGAGDASRTEKGGRPTGLASHSSDLELQEGARHRAALQRPRPAPDGPPAAALPVASPAGFHPFGAKPVSETSPELSVPGG